MVKVIIVGAGPSGMFAAYLLAKNNIEVDLIEMGDDIEERLSKIEEGNNAGLAYISGVGGSGTFSDGKLNLSPEIGGNLLEFTSQSDANMLIDYVDSIFSKYGMEKKASIHPETKKLMRKAIKAGIKYIPIKQKHIGSDFLPKIIGGLRDEMRSMGIKIHTNTKAKDIILENNNLKGILYERQGKEDIMYGDYVILAPGRSGSRWLLDLAIKYSLPYHFGPLDIGVRVEVLDEVMEEITSINWDPKFHIQTKKYDDFVRTFCTNPSGFVITEDYGKFVAVNGHSMKNKKSNNTNFAFLVRLHLTEPIENTTLYGESICMLCTTLGGGKPLIQRLGDLKLGRRSTWERINKSYVEPTNKDVTPGDISMALPGRIVRDIVEGLDMLAKVVPGVNEDSTLLYAPEVKFKAVRLNITKNMEVKQIKNLFTVGDGAGVSGGIVTAAVTGLIAAREIILREKKSITY